MGFSSHKLIYELGKGSVALCAKLAAKGAEPSLQGNNLSRVGEVLAPLLALTFSIRCGS